jgi:hypothetical protein
VTHIPLSPEAKITVERRGQIVLIGVNRPQIYNRFDPDAFFGLAKAYYDFDNDPSLRAAVFFGHGGDVPPSTKASRRARLPGDPCLRSRRPRATSRGACPPLRLAAQYATGQDPGQVLLTTRANGQEGLRARGRHPGGQRCVVHSPVRY